MNNEEFTRAIMAMTDTLYRVAATPLRQRADREDAVQECLRKAWEKRHRLREERYLQTWVIRILLNECHTIQRRMARTLPAEDIPAVQHDREPGPLKEALLRLEERYRTPILLHYLDVRPGLGCHGSRRQPAVHGGYPWLHRIAYLCGSGRQPV